MTIPGLRVLARSDFSSVFPGVIKGWHLHRRMTLNYAVPVGLIKLVLYDDREGSSTRGELMEEFSRVRTTTASYAFLPKYGMDSKELG